MIKKLVLVPRVLYSIIFMLLGIYTALPAPSSPKAFMGAFLLIFALSFVWQYLVLDTIMRTVDRRSRGAVLVLSLLASFIVWVWGVNLLANVDWLQSESTIREDLAWRMSVYLGSAGIFVGSACSRRAFFRYGAL